MQFGYLVKVPKPNSAAWLVGNGVRPLEVRPAPQPDRFLSGCMLVIKVGAVAINHLDVAAQATGGVRPRPRIYHDLRDFVVRPRRCEEYPRVLGCDLAGEVVETGMWCTKGGIRVGDRVLAVAWGGTTTKSDPAEKAFQEYVAVHEHLACVIPDNMTYEQACVFPLTMTIAANALFHEDYLELCRPTVPTRVPDASSDALIITAGASDVGCHAIQLASAAGYWVYSTASPEDFKTVQEFGARRVFDHDKRNVADDILSAIRKDNRRIAGAVAIGIDSVETCRRVLSKYQGGNGLRDNNKFIVFTEYPTTSRHPSDPLTLARCIGSTALRKMFNTISSRVSGVQIKPITLQYLFGMNNKITRMMFRDFLPRLLDSKQYAPAPQPKVVGKGLEKIQEAFDVLRDEVSAEKVVVSM